MSVFNTPRTNPNARYEEAVRVARARKQNNLLLQRQYVSEAVSADTKAKLDDQDKNSEDDLKKEMEMNRVKNKVATESLRRALGTLEHRLVAEGKDAIMDNIIFEFAYESFWMDDKEKEKAMESLFDEFKNIVEVLESTGIRKTSAMNESQLIKNIREVVTETAKKVSKRLAEDAKETCSTKDEVDEIHFEMNSDELDALDNDLSELGKEDIEDLVKSKVLAVVTDEKEAGEKKAEALQELDQAIKGETPDDTAMDSEGGDGAGQEKPEPDPEDSEVATKESFNINIARKKRAKILSNSGSSLFESIMMYQTKAISDNILMEGIDGVTPRAKMDAVFANTVFTYTVLETLNTIKLYDFNPLDIRTLSKKYMSMIK